MDGDELLRFWKKQVMELHLLSSIPKAGMANTPGSSATEAKAKDTEMRAYIKKVSQDVSDSIGLNMCAYGMKSLATTLVQLKMPKIVYTPLTLIEKINGLRMLAEIQQRDYVKKHHKRWGYATEDMYYFYRSPLNRKRDVFGEEPWELN